MTGKDLFVIPTIADKIKNKEEQDQTNLKFSDNKLLIDLCGEFDKNLAEIEQKLSVQIVRRGNELNLFGHEISRAHGKAVLEELYTRLEAGKSLDAGDLDRELRQFIDLKERDYSSNATEQIEMFKTEHCNLVFTDDAISEVAKSMLSPTHHRPHHTAAVTRSTCHTV